MSLPKATGRARRSTRQGYGGGGPEEEFEDEATSVDSHREIPVGAPPKSIGPAAKAAFVAPATVQPAVEVFLVHHDPSTASRAYPWRALEVWTRNRVYICDSSFKCIEVLNRTTGRAEPDHAFVGAQLTGGQKRDGASLELSQPLPLPGVEAVFRHEDRRRARFGQTSRVERVVLRIHVLNASLVESGPALDELSDRFSLPELGPRR